MSERLAEDWIALWQSELTAMAADRELRESIAAMLALWAHSATATVGLLQKPHDADAHRNPQTLQPARAKTAAAASEPRLDEVGELQHRIAELEQRLAGLERDATDP